MKIGVPGGLFLLAAGVAIGLAATRWLPIGASPAPAGAAAQAAPQQADGQASDNRTRVDVARVVALPVSRGVSAVGNLGSQDSAILRTEIAGRISEIGFTQGGRVRKGQVLVRLDDTVPKAELQQAQANLSLARSQYQRARELSAQGFISRQARDEASSQMQVQQAAVALAQARLDKTVIAAPFDGLVGLRNVSVGDYVGIGAELAPLESIDPLNVDFRVPEQYLAEVRVGASLAVQFDALPGQTRRGEVVAVSPLVDVGGRSILLRASIANADGQLRPGMFARVQLQFSGGKALMVPEAALAPSGRAQYAYRVRDGRVQRLEVQIGQRRDGWVEVVSGLEQGDQVVVSGLQKITDGAAVNAAEVAVAAPAAADTTAGGAPAAGSADSEAGDVPDAATGSVTGRQVDEQGAADPAAAIQ